MNKLLKNIPIEILIKILILIDLDILCEFFDNFSPKIKELINKFNIYKRIIIDPRSNKFYRYDFIFNFNLKNKKSDILKKKYKNNIIGLYKIIIVPLIDKTIQQELYYNYSKFRNESFYVYNNIIAPELISNCHLVALKLIPIEPYANIPNYILKKIFS